MEIHNKTFYADEGAAGAFMVQSETDKTAQIAQPQWDKMRVGMLCMNAADVAQTKAEEEQLCSANPGVCTLEVQQQLNAFFFKLNSALNHRGKK